MNYKNGTAIRLTLEVQFNYGGGPVQVTGTDSFGACFDVGVTPGAQEVGIIIHNPTASGGDQKGTLAHRGMYEAFEDHGSDGMKHLHSLAESGLKAVHILPSFHFASVNEDKSKWIIPTGLGEYPPDGQQQQAAVTASQSSPAYNWGYDPVHCMTPERSYAIDPDNRVRGISGHGRRPA